MISPRIHGVIINDVTLEKAYNLIDEELKLVGLADKVKSKDIIHITDRYIREGYSSYTDQDAGLSSGFCLIKNYSNYRAADFNSCNDWNCSRSHIH